MALPKRPIQEIHGRSPWQALTIYAISAVVFALATWGVLATGGYLVDGGVAAAPEGGTTDPEAQDLYLTARHALDRRTQEGLTQAVEYFGRAIVRDSTYAMAYSGLANAYALLEDTDFMTAAEAAPLARAAAETALRLDETRAEAHASLGLSLMHEGNVDAAELRFQRAIELNPSYARAHHWYSILLIDLGQTEAAVREARLARELDPLAESPADWGDRIGGGWQLTLVGRTAEAVSEARRAWELWSPGGPGMPRILGDFLFVAYDYDAAIARFEMTLALHPGGWDAAHHSYSEVLSFRGLHDEAIRMMRGAYERDTTSAFMSSELARRLHEARDYEAAIAQFEKTLELEATMARGNSGRTYYGLARAYADNGAYDEALLAIEKGSALADPWGGRALTAYVYARSGQREKALELVEQLKERDAYRVVIGTIYAALGETDTAFEWLDRGYEIRSQDLMRLKIDPGFDPLRSDPRYAVLLQKVGLE